MNSLFCFRNSFLDFFSIDCKFRFEFLPSVADSASLWKLNRLWLLDAAWSLCNRLFLDGYGISYGKLIECRLGCLIGVFSWVCISSSLNWSFCENFKKRKLKNSETGWAFYRAWEIIPKGTQHAFILKQFNGENTDNSQSIKEWGPKWTVFQVNGPAKVDGIESRWMDHPGWSLNQMGLSWTIVVFWAKLDGAEPKWPVMYMKVDGPGIHG